jgi:hypothetical protein
VTDLFLSYSFNIKDQVEKLEKNLTQAGFKVWRDEKYLNSNSPSQLEDTIAKSKIIICCLTEEYCKSFERLNENLFKLRLGKNKIPERFE